MSVNDPVRVFSRRRIGLKNGAFWREFQTNPRHRYNRADNVLICSANEALRTVGSLYINVHFNEPDFSRIPAPSERRSSHPLTSTNKTANL